MIDSDRIAAIEARCEAANAAINAEYESASYLSTRGYTTIKESLNDLPLAVEQIKALSAEVKRLREAQRWIPVVERKPTSEDGDLVGELIVWNSLHGWAELMPYTFAADGCFPQYTHWMPLPATLGLEVKHDG